MFVRGTILAQIDNPLQDIQGLASAYSHYLSLFWFRTQAMMVTSMFEEIEHDCVWYNLCTIQQTSARNR